jgi:hypothetical protein
MNAVHGTHSLPTPFALPSWEPRFAIDGFVESEMIEAALRLHVQSGFGGVRWPLAGAKLFHGHRLTPNRIVVAAKIYGFPRELHDERMFEQLEIGEATQAVVDWLSHEAVYPPKPWFDGGEGRGFQAFHVPYLQAELGPYGYLVVEPKWLEIHK